ncbi:Sodium:solute symporter family protein [Candida albicans]|uniref:Sodium:solute symporter family protein n=1 Tax=Candida albicans TaxID=5476 RepID=A0A8H6BZI5_CANAX|nr:Sodium:solute symporter family protein [Candida albicans]
MSESSVHLLNQAAGYGVLIGVGALFAGGMILTTFLLQKYLHENANSTETFSVANRSVGTFLSASAVYSSWSWSTEFLFVSSMTYNYGFQAGYYYGAGLAIQIAVMSVIGIHAKKRIPTAHTSLEAVQLRYGKAAHLLYLVLSLICNICSCSAMILACASGISIIAGNLHIVASTMLIPFGVLLYTVVDGLYDKIIEVSKTKFIEGNYDGSILTGKSKGSVIFGLVLTAGNFGLTVMDSSFWQKTFSASPRATVPAYLLTAFLIFSNVWPISAIIGGSSHFLESDPSFPTYPRKMTQYEIDSGFVLPYVLKAILGNGGVGALLLILYLAVTSTVSAQMVSVSSIVSFDIYKKYIHPNAQNKSMINVSHITCVVFGLGIAGFSIMLHYVGVNMTWFGYFIPMAICPGVIPLIFTVTWDRQTFWAAFISPIVGFAAGLTVWISTAYHFYGSVTIESTGGQLPALYGSLTALLLPGTLSIIISFIKPEKFDWEKLKQVNLLVDGDSSSEVESIMTPQLSLKKNKMELKNGFWIKISTGSVIFILLVTWVIWPMSVYQIGYSQLRILKDMSPLP